MSWMRGGFGKEGRSVQILDNKKSRKERCLALAEMIGKLKPPKFSESFQRIV